VPGGGADASVACDYHGLQEGHAAGCSIALHLSPSLSLSISLSLSVAQAVVLQHGFVAEGGGWTRMEAALREANPTEVAQWLTTMDPASRSKVAQGLMSVIDESTRKANAKVFDEIDANKDGVISLSSVPGSRALGSMPRGSDPPPHPRSPFPPAGRSGSFSGGTRRQRARPSSRVPQTARRVHGMGPRARACCQPRLSPHARARWG
jgi:hypothetical protein